MARILFSPKIITKPIKKYILHQKIHKMNRFISSCILLLATTALSLSLDSCQGAKSYVKRGEKMEAAGMIDSAVDYYITSLQKKPNNLEALSGLNRTGQIILSRHLSSFDEALLRKDKESAIRNFMNADLFFNKVLKFKVSLQFSESKRTQFETVKNDHVEELYTTANSHLEKLEYDLAFELFEEITSLVPGFKDADSLADFSYCTPAYDLAMLSMENKLYRSAYETFLNVIQRDQTYKDASERRDESLELGRFTIALVTFKNGSNRRNINTKLNSYVEQNLMGSSDPFLVVVDRESLDVILQEQQLELSGITTGNDLEIGSLLGVKAILKGTVTGCAVSTTPLRHDNKLGYEKYLIETIDSEGKKLSETKYRSVGYTEFYQSTEATLSFSLKLVSMESGAILASKTITSNTEDRIRYLKYGGNARNLYPTKSNGSVNGSSRGHNNLIGLLGERQDLKNDNTMLDEISRNIAAQIQTEIERIIKKEVK